MFKHLNIVKQHLPGQRIIKTSVAVTLCLLIYMLIGYHGRSMPAEAAITAIICMQPLVHSTTESGLSRLWGTAIGAVWGFLFLLVMALLPGLAHNYCVLYALMGLGTLIALHSAVLIRLPDASSLAAIVFICVVISYPDIGNPLEQAFLRLFDVLLGSVIAVLVNGLRLPRSKNRSKLFFVPMAALSENGFARLSPQVLFRLQYLFHKGARICLMSEHAPAFETSLLGGVKFTAPMIVMDGAAIFDPNENEYIATTNLNPTSCRWLMKRLEDESYFIYTVHRDRNCIYHHGELTELEGKVYRSLKRSPYRYYLDDDHLSVPDVVYIKLVTTPENAERLQRKLAPKLAKMKLRSVIRSQAGLENGCGLYFYASNADMAHAQEHLMYLLWQKEPELEACDVANARGHFGSTSGGAADGRLGGAAGGHMSGAAGGRLGGAAGGRLSGAAGGHMSGAAGGRLSGAAGGSAYAYSGELEAVRLLRKVDQEFEPLFITEMLNKKSGRHGARPKYLWARG